MKKLLMLVLTGLLSVAFSLAQQVVTGTVTDSESGGPLEGASVIVKGTTLGVLTGSDGKYKLSMPKNSTTLIVSYVGRKTVEQAVTGSSLDVTMVNDAMQVDEVVVTALGLKENRDQSGSSSTSINTQLMRKSGETGVIQSLAGKTSGVLVSRNSGDPGSGAYIQIRGQSTITGNLQPLIILDGMPIYNSSFSTEVNTEGVVEQSRLNDINPDDIESVQVLKGAAAAALWGTRAANGVLVITTKKGRTTSKGISVDYRVSYSVDEINRKHNLQSTWGQGTGQRWAANASTTWGDKISSRAGGDDIVVTGKGQVFHTKNAGTGAVSGDLYTGYFESQDGSKQHVILPARSGGGNTTDGIYYNADGDTLYQLGFSGGKRNQTSYLDDNFNQVFGKGNYLENSVSLSGGALGHNFMLSMANMNQQGIIVGNSDYNRTSIRLNTDHRFTQHLKASVNANYINTTSNRIQQGSNLAGLYLGLLRTSADFDNSDWLGTYYNASGVPVENSQRGYRRYLGDATPAYNNPNWTTQYQKNTNGVNRFIGGTELTYDPTSWLSIVARGGADTYNDERMAYFPNFSGGEFGGRLRRTFINETQLNSDIFARATHQFGEKLFGDVIVGYNVNDRKTRQIFGEISTFTLVNDIPPTLENAAATNRSIDDDNSLIRTNAFYASATAQYANQLFATVTARAEKATTFGKRFTYPSATVAWQFSQLEALKGNSILSFGKLRASYGVVGVQPSPYLGVTYFAQAIPADGWGGEIDPGLYGSGSYVRSTTQGNPDLEPERVTEWELGTDLRFFKDHLSIGFTYYDRTTEGAIFAVDAPASTGFSSRWANAATITNKGIEADFNLNVLTTDAGLTVNLLGNFTRNRNMVVDMSGVQSIFLAGFEGTSSRAVAGHPLGALWGADFQRNEDNILVLDADGWPKVTQTEQVIGDPNAKWRGSLGANVGYKGLSCSFLFETAQGMQMWGGTKGVLYNFGVHEDVAKEVTIPANEIATIKNYNGFTIDEIDNDFNGIPDYQPNSDGSYTVRGNLKEFNAGSPKVLLDQAWYTNMGGGFGPVASQFIYDASWTRLREVTLNYRLDNKGFREKTKLGAIEFGITGRNLLLWSPFDGIDPEVNLTGASNGRGLDYFTNPSTRSYVFTLKVSY